MTTDPVAAYLAKLPADRRDAIARVRDVVNEHLPDGYEEGIQYGGITWFVPPTVLPKTYNGQPLALCTLVSQKSGMALHMMPIYGDEKLRAWFEAAYKKSGKKLDMGKACLRFKSLDALALDVIGKTIAKVPMKKYVAAYHAARQSKR